MGRLVFIIGGSRSGKTAFALDRGMKASGTGPRVYIATAQSLDGEMADRIERHRRERGNAWQTLEEPVLVASALTACEGASVVVVDCLTLWLSNLMGGNMDVSEAESRLVEALSALKGPDVYVVSNEVGLGIVPDNAMARRFRDLAGRLNQAVARVADEVYLMACGIPVKIK